VLGAYEWLLSLALFLGLNWASKLLINNNAVKAYCAEGTGQVILVIPSGWLSN
jgi:hypothetical protein